MLFAFTRIFRARCLFWRATKCVHLTKNATKCRKAKGDFINASLSAFPITPLLIKNKIQVLQLFVPVFINYQLYSFLASSSETKHYSFIWMTWLSFASTFKLFVHLYQLSNKNVADFNFHLKLTLSSCSFPLSFSSNSVKKCTRYLCYLIFVLIS